MAVCRVGRCTRPAMAHGRCEGHHSKWLADNGRTPKRQSAGVDQATVDGWKQIAGDGDLDERCARILAVGRKRWGFPANMEEKR